MVKKQQYDLIQNLKDAGCDSIFCEQFIKLYDSNQKQEQLCLLLEYRNQLKQKIHTVHKFLDCLDYLIFEIRKEKV